MLPSSAEIDPHALDLRVQVERVLPELAPVAGLLVAAERGRGVEGVIGVDPDGARLDATRDAVGALDVARPDSGGEAVDRGVRQSDRLFLVAEGQRGQHRAEDLLASD